MNPGTRIVGIDGPAGRIDVAVDGSKVTLRGQVHSWQERDAIQGAVWAAPGVRTVVNELSVGA